MAPPEETEAAGADSNGIGGQTPTAEQKPAKRVRNSTEDGKERSAEQPLDGVSGGATSDTLLVPHPFQDATQQLCRFPQLGSAGLSWLELEFGEANEASIL